MNLTRHFIGVSISTQTGMRMGEVLGLRWSDIEFEGNRIFIRKPLSKIDENSVYGFVNEWKTNTALRVFYVHDALLDSMKAHHKCIFRGKTVLADEYLPYDLMVCTKNGS
ncbi:tyrosine-type recombinase/integrase [Halalkalibacter nanhaiisediminis]|uniref:tyrosine-type recombinase/integrase n=1 Tax=Halalkalibacter nanhaiisediminis TaxID=688079 RepID=UPI0011A6A96F